MTDRCVVCGKEVPEGRMICPICEKYSNNDNSNKIPQNSSLSVLVQIKLVSDVAEIVHIVSKCMCDVMAYSDKYIVNAKSLLGLFSLDLSKPITIEICGDVPIEVVDELGKYIVG